MQDRVPEKPGRVLVTPEDGSTAYYATLTRADKPTQEGDPLNKSTFLQDDTAALFGKDSTAVPNDIFAEIGRLLAEKAVTVTYTTTVDTVWTSLSAGGYSKTVAVEGILASDNPFVDLVLGEDITANEQALEAWACVSRVTTAEDSITLYANREAPIAAFTLQLKLVR